MTVDEFSPGAGGGRTGLRIALPNFSDVRNFGDVLFPVVTAGELRRRLPVVQFDRFTPTGEGGESSFRYDRARLDGYDAIVLAGGEVVHRCDAFLRPIYDRFALTAIERPTDLVFDWTATAAGFKAWLGVGIPRQDREGSEAIRQASHRLDLVVARGSGSTERFRRAADQSCRTGVDIGWLFPRLRPPGSVSPAPYAVFHILPGLEPRNLPGVVTALRRLERAGYEIVLLPLCTCWADEIVLEKIAKTTGFRLVDHRLPVLEKLKLLLDCSIYIGQSMHGFISAIAGGHPAGLCYPPADDRITEMLKDNGLDDLRITGWDDLPALIDRLMETKKERLEGMAWANALAADAIFDAAAEGILARARA